MNGSAKIAVVTGGTRGIGKEISLSLAQAGVKVYALYARNSKAATALEEEASEKNIQIECLRGDLTKEEKFDDLIKELRTKTDTLDIIVHSAASGVHKPALELTEKHLRWTFDINLFAIHKLLLELAPMMNKGGRIIGITSNGGRQVLPFYSAVGSSKGALESLFRHYAHEWAPRGISVNLVCPGMVLTDAVDAFPDRDDRIKKCVDETPTGRMTNPNEVAELVKFLGLNSAAAQIVGQTITVDGGRGLLA